MRNVPRPNAISIVQTIGLVVVALALSATPAYGARIFVDPGHGGSFPGAVYGGYREADINLCLARDLASVLRARGHEVMLSRVADQNVARRDIPTWQNHESALRYRCDGKIDVNDDLQARCDAANRWGADVFVSIHANAADSSAARGAETYWRDSSATDRELSNRLASSIQREYTKATGFADRRVKTNAYYVLRWSNMPAVLIETGFMSNLKDLRMLNDPRLRAAGARGIANGIEQYLATDPYQPREQRIKGADRYGTAAEAAAYGWPSGAQKVILASGEQWPDALAAAPLSRVLDAPVLLTSRTHLEAPARRMLASLRPSSIVVLGGEKAVSSQVATEAAKAAGIANEHVDRIGGIDRYETAARVAERVGDASAQVLVVSGESFPDAVSASAYAAWSEAPIILAGKDSLPRATSGFLASTKPSSKIFVVGGPAVVGDSVTAKLSAFGKTSRIYGADRYETSLAMVKRFWPDGAIHPYVATGEDYADALIAGSLAGRSAEPVLLCGQRYLPALTREWVMNETARIPSFTMVGGPNAVSYLLDWQLAKARQEP